MKISDTAHITIPKALWDPFGLNQDVVVELVHTNEGVLIQKYSRSKHSVDKVYGILSRPSALLQANTPKYTKQFSIGLVHLYHFGFEYYRLSFPPQASFGALQICSVSND